MEDANSLLFDFGYADSLSVYAMLLSNPSRYRFAFEVCLPHTYQLKEYVSCVDLFLSCLQKETAFTIDGSHSIGAKYPWYSEALVNNCDLPSVV